MQISHLFGNIKYFRVIVNNPLSTEDNMSAMMNQLLEEAKVKERESEWDVVRQRVHLG